MSNSPSSKPVRVVVATALTLAAVVALSGHTMFLKLDSYFLEPNSRATVQLINGEWELSENVITRDRMLDVSIVGPGGTANPPESAWSDSSIYHWSADSVDTAVLTFETGDAGTYTIGVSTAARDLAMTAEDFNAYLVHDGITDAIEQRAAAGKTNDDAVERYSKHVKAIVQVGDERSGEWAADLGYPAEFIPLANPYETGVGDKLEVRFLRAGEPVEGQLIYANHEENHAHDEAGNHVETVQTRTDGDGVAVIPISAAGRWYVRTIHLVETPDDPDLDYESNWATLTFQIGG